MRERPTGLTYGAGGSGPAGPAAAQEGVTVPPAGAAVLTRVGAARLRVPCHVWNRTKESLHDRAHTQVKIIFMKFAEFYLHPPQGYFLNLFLA